MLMKRTKPQRPMRHAFVTHMPPKDKLEQDVLYISLDHRTILHKCACGCGSEVSTPLSPNDWSITFNGQSISLWPSVGNWSFPCRSHYVIKNGMIMWAEDWSDEKVKEARKADQDKRENSSKPWRGLF